MEKIGKDEILALIALMADDDRFVIETVDRKVQNMTLDQVGVMAEMVYDMAKSPQDRTILYRMSDLSAEVVIAHLERELSDPYPDINNALYLLTRLVKPFLKREEFDSTYIPIVEQIAMELHHDGSPLENMEILNHIFFDRCDFKITLDINRGMDALTIDSLFKNKCGFPPLMMVSYLFVARNVGIPLYPIMLQGAGLCVAYLHNGEVLFVADPSNGGRMFSVKQLKENLQKFSNGKKWDEQQLRGTPDDKMIIWLYLDSLSHFAAVKKNEALLKILKKASYRLFR